MRIELRLQYTAGVVFLVNLVLVHAWGEVYTISQVSFLILLNLGLFLRMPGAAWTPPGRFYSL